jgi:dihydrofolate reductase
MRKLIAGMQVSVDGNFTGPDGYADWVEAWSDNYGVMPQVDACLLGAGMYGGYEQYWTAIGEAPEQPLPMTGKPATADEVKWAAFAAKTPHYVLSTKLETVTWKNTQLIRSVSDVRQLKTQPGKDIYLVGGGRTLSSLMDAGLVDELRLTVHPLLASRGQALFGAAELRRPLQLKQVQQLGAGRVSLVYSVP